MENHKAINWISALNDQTEWKDEADGLRWFARLLDKENTSIAPEIFRRFYNTLCELRNLVYQHHFGDQIDLSWLNAELTQIHVSIIWPNRFHKLPLLRSPGKDAGDESLLESLRAALLIQFACDLAESLSTNNAPCVQRCEGLYRDQNADSLTTVQEVSNSTEFKWRKEILVLVEKSLENETEIQRCADLFSPSSRSKYCSDKCRFNTFQIIKQLKEPNYLSEKQRRYREKKK